MRKKKIQFKPSSSRNLVFLINRAVSGFAGVILYFYSVKYLSLSTAAMLNKLSPIFIIIIASVFLKEYFKKTYIPVLIIVFIGTTLILKPNMTFLFYPALAGILSALFSGISYTSIRFLKDKEESEKIIFYFAGISSLIISPSLLFLKSYDFIQFTILLLIGIFATGGQYFLTLSFHNFRAGEISLISYSQILLSLFFGLLLFGEIPDIYSCLGGLLIITGGIIFYQIK